MQDIGKSYKKQEIKEALSRNKRLKIKSKPLKKIKPKTGIKEMLSDYIFTSINMTPLQFIGTLENQFYAEQNFRARRQRNVDAVRGRLYGDLTWDDEREQWVTEAEFLRRRNIPLLSYNISSKLVRSLVGQYRETYADTIVKSDNKDPRANEISHILTECLARVKTRNKCKNKDAFNYKEMNISGRPVFKTMWGSKYNATKVDVKTRTVPTDKFMVNAGISDYDMDNLHTALEIHDTTVDEIITLFANGDYERGQEIKRGYINNQGDTRSQGSYSSQSYDGEQRRNQSFYTQGVSVGSYRYYEIWTLVSNYEAITYDNLDRQRKIHKYVDPDVIVKEVEAINEMRKAEMEGEVTDQKYLIDVDVDYNSRMYAMYITPWGDLLDVAESPFADSGHPYSFIPPDINGEIWGIVEEIIDAQKSMNRQIVQADSIVQNAIKGMVFIPDTSVPDEFTEKEYIRKVKSVDGAAIYKVNQDKPDLKPFQMYANSSNVSANVQQLIGLYSSLVDDISGNYGAAQGQTSTQKTASGYAMETQNAGLNIRDIAENYGGIIIDRDEKMLSLISSGYTKEDYLEFTGKDLDPLEIKKYEFYVEESKGINSPAHRLALEQELLQLVYNQLLPFEVFLEVSNNPVMKQAKQKMEELQKRQSEQGMNPAGQVAQPMSQGMSPNEQLQTQVPEQKPLQ